VKIENSTFLITGGTMGIGHATAKLLIASGGKVAITGRDKTRTETAARELGAFPITADVANPEDVKRTYQAFLQEFGKLDCLINNAGLGLFKRIEDCTVEDFEYIYRINVFGAALMAGEAAKLFKQQNSGNIINIASTAGTKGFEGGSIYASSKFALRGMTQCWQAELRKHNVRVILINPSEVTTAFNVSTREEKPEVPNKLRGEEIAHAIKSSLEMDDRGFIPELTVWATNPF
jgi:3-oxoacyl-[acyl-carrier protein] reductase